MNFNLPIAALIFLLLSLWFEAPKLHSDDHAQFKSRPNIILVMTDDQGYGDLSCHGHPVLKTPNLDSLHKQSVRFTDFHVSPTCAPTRAALMSGRDPFKNGVTHTILERDRMALSSTTIAEVLQSAGYKTGIFGKWHLGDADPYQPQNRGFDEVFIHGAGGIGQSYSGTQSDAPGTDYFDPIIKHNNAFVKTKGYCTDVFFQQALDWIQDQKEQPFFAYIPTNAPHGPFKVAPKYSDVYKGTGGKNTAKFLGMVANIDENMGLLMEKLGDWELLENTLLIFMTDNGSADATYNYSMRGKKGTAHEGGTRVPLFVRMPGKTKPGVDVDRLTRHFDIFPTLAAVAEAKVPADVPLDGRNLLPLIYNPESEWEDRNLFFHVGRWSKKGAPKNWGKGNTDPDAAKYRRFAVRNQKWRLVEKELFDISTDPQQSTDVADKHPDVIANLMSAYDSWWDEVRPLMVNEDASLDTGKPFRDQFLKQQAETGIPAWAHPRIQSRKPKPTQENTPTVEKTEISDMDVAPDKTVAYKTTPQGELKLHLFEPKSKLNDKPVAAVVFFFGGGWNTGTPKQFYPQAEYFSKQGMLAVAAEYRVKKRHKTTPFDCVEDAKSAIRWLRSNAKQMGVAPDKIVAAGGSAGGHLAACTGIVSGLESTDEDHTISSKPNAMILFNPVLDTSKRINRNKAGGRKRAKEISPVHHVQAGIVPTLVFHGTADRTVPFENAERFNRLMKEAGNNCELKSFAGKGHGFFNSPDFRPANKDERDYQQTLTDSHEFLSSLGFIAAKPEKQSELATTPSANKNSKPNIIVIYTDDQGYGDVSAYNPDAKFQTPNLDRLAKGGIRFTNAHAADAVCTPSRYSLLTGRYAWRTKMKRSVLGAEADCLIEPGRMSLASMLKDNGYNTAMVGKWHLGMQFHGDPGSRDWTQPVQDMPLDKGFDYFYGIPASLNYGILAWFEGRYAAVPPTLFTNKKKNNRHVDYRIMPPYEETPEEVQQKLKRKGFEIAPDFVDEQCLTRFTDKAIAWMQKQESQAQNGKPFFLYLPYTSPHYPVCPLPQFHGQGNAGAYGEFVIETDYHVGRVLDYLESANLADNTLIVFTSDNGPENSWRKRIDEFDHDSRGGLRGGKRSIYEGGHRVPFMVRWPDGINKPGRTYDGLIGQTDLLATFAELIGISVPDDAGEDSQSFAKFITNTAMNERLPLINHTNTNDFQYAITDGDWKLIMPGSKKGIELYDLSNDRRETTNLADQQPELVKKLTKRITEIVLNGRTTPGKVQANDTGHWPDLTWITKEEFERGTSESKSASPAGTQK